MVENFGDHVMRRPGWLAGTPAAFQAAVLARSDRVSVAAGHGIYHFGDDVGGIFGVIDGQLEIHGRTHGDTPTLNFIAGPGFWTGEFATVTGRPRIISLVAHTDVALLRLPRAEFLRIAGADPQAWHQLALLATRNTAIALELIEMLRRPDPVDRLIHLLHLLLREVPLASCTVSASQADLGAMARMSRSSVNAVLRVLEARGLARPVYRGIEILDPDKLDAIARGD